MEFEQALALIAEVAIGLLGFTAVVAVLGRRARGDWTTDELLTFRVLLETSATALFVSFVPGLLAMTGLADGTVWRVSNAVLGGIHLASFSAFLFRVRGASTPPTLGQKLLSVTAVLIIGAHLLVATGVIGWARMIFLLGLLQQLYVGVHNFVLLLFPVTPIANERT